MSTRKQANRAEGIVRAVGAFIMVLFLGVMVYEMPNIVKNKSTEETMHTMWVLIFAFVGTTIALGILGVFVWLKVLKGKRKD